MASTYPRPRAPLVVVAASLLLGATAGVTAALRLPEPPTFAVVALVAAIVPWRMSDALRRRGIGLCFFVFAWAVFGLSPLITVGKHLPGPYGGHAATFLAAMLASGMKLWALSTEGARHWCAARWVVGTSAEPAELRAALARALKSGIEERDQAVDVAVVSIARASAREVPADEAERRGFFIDVYNLLALHARRGRRSVRSWDVLESYRTRYEAFGRRLSNDEIEHAVLRGNRPHPAGFSRPFSERDPRRGWVVSLDPRVHFAQNCGLYSCPLIRSYWSADVDARLEAAATFHVTETTKLDDASRSLEVSQLFEFYADDFGGPAGIRAFVARHLSRAPDAFRDYRLTFTPYDRSAAFRFAE